MKNNFKVLDYSFDSSNEKCMGSLYLPNKKAKCPVIVMGSGFGATRDMALNIIARNLANEGYACFIFDYRNFGESGGKKRQIIKYKEQLEDFNSAIDFVKMLDEIDKNKIAIYGISFGGGHAITIAAERNDIKAAIAQCPYVSGRLCILNAPLQKTLRVLPYFFLDLLSCLTGYHPVMIKLEGKRNEPCLFVFEEDNLKTSYEKLKGKDYKNYTPARSLLEFFKYSPKKYIKDIKIPVFYTIATKDEFTPPKETKEYIKKTPNAIIHEYNCGHFESVIGDVSKTIIKDYVEFLDNLFK